MRRLFSWFSRPDVLLDLHLYGGLALAGWGGWQLSRSWAAVGVGLGLILLGLWGSRRKPVG